MSITPCFLLQNSAYVNPWLLSLPYPTGKVDCGYPLVLYEDGKELTLVEVVSFTYIAGCDSVTSFPEWINEKTRIPIQDYVDCGGPLVLYEDGKELTVVEVVSFTNIAGCDIGYDCVTSFLEWINEKTDIAIQDYDQ
ncbi:uncharacterized protein CBL_09940 [Carabus blaptoides fortunei]